MNDFERWLESGSYREGISILIAHNASPVLVRFLENGESAFAHKKLKDAIEKLRDQNPVLDQLPAPAEESVSENMKKYSPEVIMLFKQRAEFHTLLKNQTNDADRLKLAFRIKAICKRIERLLADPEPSMKSAKIEIPDSPGEMMKVLNRNRPYISKYKDDPMKAGEVSRRKKQNELISDKLGLN